MILFDPRTGQFVNIDPLPSIQPTEAGLGKVAACEPAAPADGHENALSKTDAAVVSMSTPEQATSIAAGAAAALAVLGALGALYLPLLWA
jgi:hypothetical protein